MWQQWVNVILGLWILLSGYLNFDPSTYSMNLTISGIAVAALALWGALEYRNELHVGRHMHA